MNFVATETNSIVSGGAANYILGYNFSPSSQCCYSFDLILLLLVLDVWLPWQWETQVS